jgi:hypothetical protein
MMNALHGMMIEATFNFHPATTAQKSCAVANVVMNLTTISLSLPNWQANCRTQD